MISWAECDAGLENQTARGLRKYGQTVISAASRSFAANMT